MVAEVALDEIGERRVLQVPHSNMTLKSINVDMIKIATLPPLCYIYLELLCLLLTDEQRRSKNDYSVNTRVFVEVDFFCNFAEVRMLVKLVFTVAEFCGIPRNSV